MTSQSETGWSREQTRQRKRLLKSLHLPKTVALGTRAENKGLKGDQA